MPAGQSMHALTKFATEVTNSFGSMIQVEACPMRDLPHLGHGRQGIITCVPAWQVYQPSRCMLPRWDAEGCAAQLKGRRLIIVGDSLQRQLFLSLACLLAKESVSGSLVSRAGSRLPINDTHHSRCASLLPTDIVAEGSKAIEVACPGSPGRLPASSGFAALRWCFACPACRAFQ